MMNLQYTQIIQAFIVVGNRCRVLNSNPEHIY